jgi:mono/diheme cytochrome c family protein
MKKYQILSTFFFLYIFISCSSDSIDDDIIPANSNVTYSSTIKKIMDKNCLNCHSDPTKNGAPMPLTTYEHTREAVENRGLIGRVENGSMPSTGSNLTAVQIKAIKDWEIGGFAE